MYWRRRLLAGAVVVAAVIAVIILIVALSGRSGDDSDTQSAAATSSTQKPAGPANPSDPAQPSESAPSSEAPSGGGDHGGGGDPSAPPAPPSTPAPADGGGPATCADQSLSVVLYTDKPTYSVGDNPVFTIVTTNGGLAECSRDVGKAAQNVIVRTLDGSRTLWAAQDCAPDPTVDVQVLQPGQQVSDTITWSGTTSSPKCKKKRVQVVPGGYQATAKVGERESAPITFNIVAPAEPGGQ